MNYQGRGRKPSRYSKKPLKHRHERQQDKQGTFNITFDACSCNHCCCGKAISITYSECVSSLTHSACNAQAPYCHLWPARLYDVFHTISQTERFSGGKKRFNIKMCLHFLYNVCLIKFPILRRKE